MFNNPAIRLKFTGRIGHLQPIYIVTFQQTGVLPPLFLFITLLVCLQSLYLHIVRCTIHYSLFVCCSPYNRATTITKQTMNKTRYYICSLYPSQQFIVLLLYNNTIHTKYLFTAFVVLHTAVLLSLLRTQ